MPFLSSRCRSRSYGLAVLFLLGAGLAATTDAEAGGKWLFQNPTVNQTRIVFAFGGDLWSVLRAGGEASRLTSGPGIENYPVFSPDGTKIAFTGEYDGNVDVFVMAAEGGVPRRLTWHPAADAVLGWTSDGRRVLFTSGRTAYSGFNELFTVGLDGGLEERLPLPMGYEASYARDGKRLAYVPISRAFYAWKRYRGGRATPIWIADLADSRIEKVPRENSNDFNPMWIGDKVYFLSDRLGPVSLFVYDATSKNVDRVLPNDGLDIKSAAAGPGVIVFEQFGGLNLFDLNSGKASRVSISAAGDFPEVRERYVAVGRRLTNPSLSPNAARAAFEARGEIVTVPAEKGDPRNLTLTPGVMERSPAWSPDGETIAYLSDESGEYQLHLKPQNGAGETVKIALEEKPTFYGNLLWSPDSKKIAYQDAHLALWYVDIAAKKPVRVDKDRFLTSRMTSAWSPDSKWLTYSKALANYMGAIFVYSLETGKSVQVTDGMSDAGSPVFDAGGKYLYFTASTDSGQSLQPDVQAFSKPVSSSIYFVVLSKADPSPLAPESDEEKGQEEKKPGDPAQGLSVKIDFDHILQRVLTLPMPARYYAALIPGKPDTLLAVETSNNSPAVVHRYEFKARRSDVVISGVGTFVLAANGEKYLTSQGDRWSIGALRPMPPAGAPTASAGPAGAPLPTDAVQIKVDPRQEWRQMFREVWRVEREYLYDPQAHGYDLAAAEKRYEPFLRNVVSRRDLNYLFAEMLGGIEIGHLGVGGGDLPEVNRIPTGLLGADYRVENGRYRFARVYNGENWNPNLRAPLTQPGINVAAGEFLLAVNGRELTERDNVYAFFESTTGKQVTIRVGPSPDGKGAREVTVVPVGSETSLRHFAWIEENRRYVDKVSGGKVAYVYMPDTSFGGFTYFNRYFYSQVGKEALIVDERFNAGGLLATDVMEVLLRKRLSAGGHPRRRGRDPAAGGHFRAQGHAHQRIRRIGRRRHALLLQGHRSRPLDRQKDLGRIGRAGRRATAHGWRLRLGPQLGGLEPKERMDRRERRHCSRHRSGTRSRARAAGERPPAREGRRDHHGRAG